MPSSFPYSPVIILSICRNFCVYLHTENQLHRPRFSGDIATGMPGYTHLKWQYQLAEIFNVYLHAKNKLHHSLFLRYYILKNTAIWLAESILTHNLRTRILPGMGLVGKYFNNNISFILDYFQKKLTKFFKK